MKRASIGGAAALVETNSATLPGYVLDLFSLYLMRL